VSSTRKIKSFVAECALICGPHKFKEAKQFLYAVDYITRNPYLVCTQQLTSKALENPESVLIPDRDSEIVTFYPM
jgi:hypothetical protein